MENKEKLTLTRIIWAKAIELGFNFTKDDAHVFTKIFRTHHSEFFEEMDAIKNRVEHLEHELKSEVALNNALQDKINGINRDQDQEDNPPYLTKKTLNLDVVSLYNPKYGDDRECECGDPYYRHFDTYENMEAVGCKYCECNEFKEAICSCEVGHPYQTAACPVHRKNKE